ncbi:MAG: putative DMT superfamily transporter inner membrane protein [Candidatus Cloacimonetes bacterium ADurb.Bin088]|nr:MAG: putative DMT superfamily transporter inner membrane protein [Candidatus Cloacimonetes bacterium ADurb.Bin088]
MKQWTIYLRAVLAMLFWAVTFVWIKVALVTYRPYEIVFLRLLLASVLLFGVTRLFRQSEKVSAKDLRYLMLVAFCEPFMYFIGEANGMQYVSPTLGSLIISTIPLVSALGAWIFLKERIYPLLIVGLLVSFSGVALLSFAEPDLHGTLKGVLLLMVAVFSGMFYGITVRRMTLKYRSLTIVTWQNFFGMLYMLPLFLYYDLGHFLTVRHSAVGLLTIAAMSVFASVGAFLLYTGVIRELGLIRSNVFTNLIPVFTVFLAFFILGERLSLRGAAGVTLTVLGLLISQSHDLRQLRRKSLCKNLSQSGM